MGKTRMPAALGMRDQIRQSLYDTITIAAATSPIGNYQFFSNTQGKALFQTNLRQPNALESQVSFMVQGLSVEAQNQVTANASGLALIMEFSYLDFRIGEKSYWEGPMRFLAGRMWHSAATGNASDYTYEQFGAAKANGVLFRGALEMQEIGPLQAFRVDWACSGMNAAQIVLATPAANSSFPIVFRIQGLKRRPVQ
jgi:hypothetical protein